MSEYNRPEHDPFIIQGEDGEFYPAMSHVSQGDCLETLRKMEGNSIDAVITDPPYGISYKASSWDKTLPNTDVWRECLRVLKPGGHLIAACATKMYHRLGVNIEDAGFEIRDTIAWTYTHSFPGSQTVDDEWRSNLKTNQDPWVVARKPLEKGLSLKQNYEKWGTGALKVGRTGEVWKTNVLPVPKAKKAEMDLGLDREERKVDGAGAGGAFTSGKRMNTHPTTKPIALMRQLCRLACKPGGVVLDPFAGSGTTGMAAVSEGMKFWGCEMERQYFADTHDRVVFSLDNPEKLPK